MVLPFRLHELVSVVNTPDLGFALTSAAGDGQGRAIAATPSVTLDKSDPPAWQGIPALGPVDRLKPRCIRA